MSLTGTLAAAAAADVFDRVLVLDRDKLEVSVEVLKQPNLEFESLSEANASSLPSYLDAAATYRFSN